ncbi:MAG: hypothetical protein JXA89_23460 [Anaerolineae bacterium]|nr:hypothetical protein [Anaerolineae bacterium]
MIVAIDYDGTIADTNREKSKWIKVQMGIDVSPWHCNRTDCVPIIGEEAYRRLGDWVYERESTLQAEAVPGALDALRTLAESAELCIVTARPERRIGFAREWLAREGVLHLIREIRTSKGTSKAEVCSSIEADVLVDDDVRHLHKVDVEGLQRIWLQHGREGEADGGPGVIFCASWRHVLDQIEKKRSGISSF